MTKLTLYTNEVCPYAQRTRILLAEKAIEHEAVELDFNDKPQWFLDLTPNGRVPVIRHDDFVLWESATINEYLDAVFPGPRLALDDERARAVMRNEIRHFDAVFLPTFYQFLFAQEAATQDDLRQRVYAALESLDQRVGSIQDAAGGGALWMGAELSLADCAMFPFFERFEVFDYYRGFELPASCARLARWFDALSERPAFGATMHDLEYFIPLYAEYAGGTASGLSAQAFRAGAVN